MFTPEESIACARNFYENVEKIWGRYGFADAFNPDKKWYDDQVIGIDQGAILLMIENYRTQMIWDVMSRFEPIQKAMQAVGFKEGQAEIEWPEPPSYKASRLASGIKMDALLSDWPHAPLLRMDLSHREGGTFDDEKDLGAEMRFAWDDTAFYFYAKIQDSSLSVRRSGKNIWQDDVLELYVDPDGDGLNWNKLEDFQIGFSPVPETGEVKAWSWFGREEDPVEKGQAVAASFTDGSGYIIEGAVQWEYLGIKPEPGKIFGLSAAVHDADQDRSQGKMHWFFRNEDREQRFVLGSMELA